VAAGAVAVPRNAILTAGEALTVKFQALRVPTVATFARTLVHVHRRSRLLANIGDLTVLSRIWNHLVLGVYDLPVFGHRSMVRPAEIGVLTGRGLKMVVSEERGALSYATHEDGLIDLGPGYRVCVMKNKEFNREI